MSKYQPLISYGKATQEFRLGLYPSVHAQDVPLWLDGKNIYFLPEGIVKAKGWEKRATLQSRASAMAQSYIPDLHEKRLYVGCDHHIYKWINGVLTPIHYNPEVGIYSLEAWGRHLLATNGTEKLMYWQDDAGIFLPVPVANQFEKVEIIKKFKNYVLAFATSGGDWGDGNVMHWCSIDNVTDWEPRNDNSAGNMPFSDLDSDIKCVSYLRDYLSVYSSDSMWLVGYEGGSLIFARSFVTGGIGAVGKNAVVSTGLMNFGIARNGMFSTDGTGYSYIDIPPMQRYLQENINWDYAYKICGYFNEKKNTIEFYYPEGESRYNNKGVGYNFLTQSWTKFDYGRDAVMEREVFDTPYGCSELSLFQLEITNNADGEILPAELVTKPMLLSVDTLWKYIDIIDFLCKQNLEGSLEWRVGFQEEEEGEAWYTEWANVPISSRFAHLRDSGVFVKLELRSNLLDSEFLLSGFNLYGEDAGYDI